ncbi:hypothetical protein [Parabacteroides distasonis]|uniref:hypothetical protein n=2 Tax=Parabacteroides distasonis TaxID=823 RepID=UPI00189E4DB4|nr:hypothetical protein [Parabacteroides distasonis]MDB9154421.1 hypothetical protein [Parabacteroides distasonis]MDB9158966.1 hypothetical protein [Parabacteroides distasonis]MDB9164186.1 hypothetical protein [Parabacteroides distasonis]MDB9172276.1 hypothetical protein [Parabacteroides distasonis]MDB9197162.1 hypothetical protein [Parabacteroides distasonis]
MKNILPLLGVFFIMLLSCSKVEPIRSLDQLEPALRKHVGNPSRIDTTLKGWPLHYNVISYHFDSVSDVSFDKLVWFLFEAYDTKPFITAESGSREARFVPLQDGSGIYMIQLLEWRQKDTGKDHLSFSIFDVEDELVLPSQSILK